jgi:hypothetical protein
MTLSVGPDIQSRRCTHTSLLHATPTHEQLVFRKKHAWQPSFRRWYPAFSAWIHSNRFILSRVDKGIAGRSSQCPRILDGGLDDHYCRRTYLPVRPPLGMGKIFAGSDPFRLEVTCKLNWFVCTSSERRCMVGDAIDSVGKGLAHDLLNSRAFDYPRRLDSDCGNDSWPRWPSCSEPHVSSDAQFLIQPLHPARLCRCLHVCSVAQRPLHR